MIVVYKYFSAYIIAKLESAASGATMEVSVVHAQHKV